MIRPLAYAAGGLVVGAAASVLVFGLAPRAGQGIEVPSGQAVAPYEILWERNEAIGETWVILRFIAPGIARGASSVTFDQAEGDLAALCRKVGLAVLSATGTGDRIVVNLMDRALARGTKDPSVTQFNDVFVVRDGDCISE